jgi:RNA polymerase sigma-70 factor (ECF subfamily)
VWQRAGDFDPASSSPVTWLATIARNRALDEIRRGTMRSLEDHPELLQVPSDDDPSTNLERKEQLRRLDACLEGLEPEKKEMVLLAYYYGLTREEISNRFGRPVATVKTWLRRSLAQLKDCLARGSVRDDPLIQKGDASCGRLTAGMRPPAMPRPEAAADKKQSQSPATQKPPPSSGTSSST